MTENETRDAHRRLKGAMEMKDDHSEEMREMNSRENRIPGEGLGGHPRAESFDELVRGEKERMRMFWRPIETVPTTDVRDVPKTFLLWVANGGDERTGSHAIGYAYRSHSGGVVPRAHGYGAQGWKITHWMPLPEPPSAGDRPAAATDANPT